MLLVTPQPGPMVSMTFLIVKFNSSGTLQWSRKFGCDGTHDTSHGIVVDSSGNSYIVVLLT